MKSMLCAWLLSVGTLVAHLPAPPAEVIGKAGAKKIVFLIGEREYATEKTVPAFAREHLTDRYRCQFLHAADGSNDFGDVATALKDADALFISVRRRAPATKQMAAIRAFIKAGKPVIGIRTASHAFSLRGKPAPEGHAVWEEFDPQVFGGNYSGHHGSKIKSFAVSVGKHPLVKAMRKVEFATGGSLYKVLPLNRGATVLLEGRAETVDKRQPVAWTYENLFGGHSFYTSLGHVKDFADPQFTAFLKRAVDWVIAAKAEKKIGALTPEESLGRIRVPDDLQVDLMLAEPVIAQPLHMSFDERGRLWVVEYRQYPHPAGLEPLSRDAVWRVAYDRDPPPPPHAKDSPFRGKDRISIHEDTDHDGVYDSHKIFMDGLNMATSLAHGDGGVWVTNPPYLLFIPDRDGDDAADEKDIEVHLRGFGLEDSHAIANSLKWGPDGWLYGSQGSTVSAAITTRYFVDSHTVVKSMGQNIWRFHPNYGRYEIYAEGGGNAFGVEIDSKGNVFSGHNGGNTRGFHYWHGAYYRKNWGKHGALTNPYAYGFFPAMENAQVARFTHQFIIYEETGLPERYRGKLWGVDVLHHNVVLSEMLPHGSTFKTRDIERVVQSSDPWFRPVMVTEAPDGSVFIADWYDEQVNHYLNHEGRIDPKRGRIYRVRARGSSPDAGKGLASVELKDLLRAIGGKDRWHRRTARRLVGENRRVRIEAVVQEQFKGWWSDERHSPDTSLEQFWLAREVLGAGDAGLQHPSAVFRRAAWQQEIVAPNDALKVLRAERDPVVIATALSAMAARPRVERYVATEEERYFPLRVAMEIARRNELADDPHIPMLVWWAIEPWVIEYRKSLMGYLQNESTWQRKIIHRTILPRLMRRYAAEESAEGYRYCAKLLRRAPDAKGRAQLLEGFQEEVIGKPVGVFPIELQVELKAIADELSVILQVRVGMEGAVERALEIALDTEKDATERASVIAALSEQGKSKALVALLENRQPEQVDIACVAALAQHLQDETISSRVLQKALATKRGAVRDAAIEALAEQSGSALKMLAASKDLKISADDTALAGKLRAHNNFDIDQHVERIWGKANGSAVDSAEIARIQRILEAPGGVPKAGQQLFEQRCASCHSMFGRGGSLGPDLTSYQRSDAGALLLAIVAPDTEIRDGFEHSVVRMKSGAVHSGFQIGSDEHTMSLRTMAGGLKSLPQVEIEKVFSLPNSIMPGGLLKGLDDDALRDLFAYLRSTTPPY